MPAAPARYIPRHGPLDASRPGYVCQDSGSRRVSPLIEASSDDREGELDMRLVDSAMIPAGRDQGQRPAELLASVY